MYRKQKIRGHAVTSKLCIMCIDYVSLTFLGLFKYPVSRVRNSKQYLNEALLC